MVPGPVNVKVVPLIVAGFIARLKVALTGALGHAPVEALRGVTEVVVGGMRPGLAPGLQHPGLKMRSKNADNQILALLYLRMTVNLLFPGSTAPPNGIATLAIF